jgi:hypothetical protein
MIRADLIATIRRSPGSSKGNAKCHQALPLDRRRSSYFIGRLSRHLTRRANHQYIFIIARIQKPAPGKPGRGLFQPRIS